MKFIVRHWEWTLVVALLSYYLVWLVNVKIRNSKIPKNREVVTMPLPEITKFYNRADSIQAKNYAYPRRIDSYGIKDIDRSDSSAIINLIAGHFCKSIDTISLGKYQYYSAYYYAYGVDFNNSLYHFHRPSRPLNREAMGPEVFVCSINYFESKLSSIIWYPSGEVDDRIVISKERVTIRVLEKDRYLLLTPLLEAKFGNCRSSAK